jgi:predicted aminopeptidase
LLKYDQEILANTILHELFHSTFYLPGQTALNESLANFAGHRGAIAFFAREAGAEAEATKRAIITWQSELTLSGFFGESAEKLNALYASVLAEEGKLQQREVLFQQLQEGFKQLPVPVRRNTDFSSIKLNNAIFLQQFVYLKELALFERVYQQNGHDLKTTLTRITEAAKKGADPFAEVRTLASLPALEMTPKAAMSVTATSGG